MGTPTTSTMLNLLRHARTRTLQADEIRYLREGITNLDQTRARSAGLRRALHEALTDGAVYAAACRRINTLVTRWREQPPSNAATRAAVDALTEALAPTQGAS